MLHLLGTLLFFIGTFLYMYPATVNLRKYDAISAVYYHKKWGKWLTIGGALFGITEFLFVMYLAQYLNWNKFGIITIPFGAASFGLVLLSYFTAGRNKAAKYLHLPLVISYCFFTAIGALLLGIGLYEQYPIFSIIDFIIIGFYTVYLPLSIYFTKEVYWAAYMHGLIHYPWYLALFLIVLK